MTDAYGDTLTKRVAENPLYNVNFTTLDTNITAISVPSVTSVKQNKVTEVLDLTVGTPSTQTTILQVELSDGTDGELYKLIFRATDNNGKVREIVGWIEVEEVPSSSGMTVETGAGLANAESYVTLAESNIYFRARRSTDWLNSDPFRKEAALREAARFIDGRYTWPGQIRLDTQALDWPRSDARDTEGRLIEFDTVPQRVKDAQCEAALLALTGSLLPATARGGQTKAVKLGPLAVTFDDNAKTSRSFEWLDAILQGLYISNAARARHQLQRG